MEKVRGGLNFGVVKESEVIGEEDKKQIEASCGVGEKKNRVLI